MDGLNVCTLSSHILHVWMHWAHIAVIRFWIYVHAAGHFCSFFKTLPPVAFFPLQEARTLEMNNVQDGNWRGRGDTIWVGSYATPAGSQSIEPSELRPPVVITISSDHRTESDGHSWTHHQESSDPLMEQWCNCIDDSAKKVFAYKTWMKLWRLVAAKPIEFSMLVDWDHQVHSNWVELLEKVGRSCVTKLPLLQLCLSDVQQAMVLSVHF